jgi:hypothetical protein
LKLIDLLIIGTQKAGTTSLYEYIKQHNNIYFSEVKEITYFVNDDLHKKGKDYLDSFFSKHKNEKIIASSYVHMLPSKDAPERVLNYNSNMKFIVMLRDPTDRAFSAYNYAIKNGWENKKVSFLDSLNLEKERIINKQFDLTYFYNGLYKKHLDYWKTFFPENRFLTIWDYELKNEPKKVLERICRFLCIEYDENIDFSLSYNKAGIVRSKIIQRFLLSKNSKLKNFFGKLIPRNFKVFIRANLLSKLYKFNHIDLKNPEISSYEKKILKKYFESNKIE